MGNGQLGTIMEKKKKRNTIKRGTRLVSGIIILRVVRKKVLSLTRMIIKMASLFISIQTVEKNNVKKAGKEMWRMVCGYGGQKMVKRRRRETIKLARNMGSGLVIIVEDER